LAAGALAAGCNKPTQAQPAPPADVTVGRPVEHQVVEWDSYSGTLSSPKIANVEARVSGLILEAPFTEGTLVKQGQELYKIDPSPFQADLDSQLANLAKAKSQQALAQANVDRLKLVRGTKAISEQDYETAVATLQQAKASVAAAEAAVKTARLNLGWTTVTAPISGRIGRKLVTVGNLVNGGSGQTTLLTTIVSIDPIYCYVNVPDVEGMRYLKISAEERHDNVADARIACYLQLPGENAAGYPGIIDFVNNQVDTGTGTVEIRGVFANPRGLLTPGMIVLMRIPATAPYKALLIPDAAVNTNQNERYLLIVGPDNVVSEQPVTLGAVFGKLRAITSGLKPGELVVTDGVQFARPGAKVNPHEASFPTDALNAIDLRTTLPPSSRPSRQPVTGPSTAPTALPAASLLPPLPPAFGSEAEPQAQARRGEGRGEGKPGQGPITQGKSSAVHPHPNPLPEGEGARGPLARVEVLAIGGTS